MFAYANSLANLAGFFGPNLVAVIVSDPMRHESWFPLWILSAVIFFAGGLTFCIFAENSPQNYCRKPKARGSGTQVSQAQLMECVEPEIFKMDAFARVASEPNPRQLGRRSSKGDAYLS